MQFALPGQSFDEWLESNDIDVGQCTIIDFLEFEYQQEVVCGDEDSQSFTDELFWTNKKIA